MIVAKGGRWRIRRIGLGADGWALIHDGEIVHTSGRRGEAEREAMRRGLTKAEARAAAKIG